MSPQVTVIIPVFNRAERLARAVDSVLEQEGVSFELLVVDDASTQPAEEVYRKVTESGHRVVRQARNSGPGAARNRGAQLATAPWLSFLDSDDHWLPGKLEQHLAHLEESGRKIGQTDEIWYRHGERVNPPKPHRISGGDLLHRSLKAVCVSSSTVMLRREFFVDLGGFDEELFVCEDYDLWLQASAREPFEHLEIPLVVKYGGHEDQLSQALPAMDRYRIFSILKGLHRAWFREPVQRESAHRELARKLRILSKGSAKRGREEAVELCGQLAVFAEQERYASALELASRLLELWSTAPSR